MGLPPRVAQKAERETMTFGELRWVIQCCASLAVIHLLVGLNISGILGYAAGAAFFYWLVNKDHWVHASDRDNEDIIGENAVQERES